MYRAIDDFIATWNYEASSTQKLFEGLRDDVLMQAVDGHGRTIARLAWHIAQTIPEMMALAGLQVTGIGAHDPVPERAAPIAAAYKAATESLVEQVRRHWTDATLSQVDDMYGEQWTRGQTLAILVAHQAHHRGQLTVLMRQAGLPVPGIYGPAREEWGAMGMEPPPV
ncbi:MAG: DinB family protein [Gemmatimonadaceae bacterium]|nr:DinB family protein [Gemmatimonadaceae bacterium]